ncbi:TPA_asm: Soluble KIT ligand, partial [Listeria monocytogenes]|nr:Soluble KIT ligand [Listeria monocytogenes]
IIVGFMFGFFRKKRVKNLLKSIELSVINESKQKQEKLAAKSEQ